MDWRLIYVNAYQKYFTKKYPAATKDFGVPKCSFPSVTKSNGLTKMIINFITWNGSHAERTNNMGRPVEKKIDKMNIITGKVQKVTIGMQWQKGAGEKGSSDIKSHIKTSRSPYPVPVYIEIKIGRDSQSQDQKRYQEKVEKTGALYWIVKTPEDFFTKWFDLI